MWKGQGEKRVMRARGEECEDKGAGVSMSKRVKLGPVFSDDQEATIIEFVKAHPELYTNENPCYIQRSGKTLCGTSLVDS